MKRIVLAALAASTVFATPAFAAGTTAEASTAFTGDRAVVCNLTGVAATIDFGDLGNKGAAPAQTNNGIDLFCNQPFSVTLTSQNGYLKLHTTNGANNAIGEAGPFESAANPGFAAGLDYSATAILGSTSVTGDSSQITGATPTFIGNSPALNVHNAKVRYDTIAGSLPLLGGIYQDTLTITLTTLGV